MMAQKLPHFAIISCAFHPRFTAKVIEGVFLGILEEPAQVGGLPPKADMRTMRMHMQENAEYRQA